MGELYAITGRTMATITSPEETAIAQKVIAALAMIEAMGGGEKAIAVLEAPWLKSFTAGSYSEQRFSPQELANAKAAPYPPGLWALMWALMIDAKRDEWLERLGGQRRPAGVFIGMDWGETPSLGPAIFGDGVDHWEA